MLDIEPVITVDLVLVFGLWVGSLADQIFLSDEVPAYGVRQWDNGLSQRVI